MRVNINFAVRPRSSREEAYYHGGSGLARETTQRAKWMPLHVWS